MVKARLQQGWPTSRLLSGRVYLQLQAHVHGDRLLNKPRPQVGDHAAMSHDHLAVRQAADGRLENSPVAT